MSEALDKAVKETVEAAQRPPRLCIGVPSSDMLHADFAIALTGLVAFTLQHGVAPMIANPKTSYIHQGRNLCVQAAIDAKADFLLFLDSDMVFPPETALRLLSHRKDIVGGTYVKRVSPHPVLGSPHDGSTVMQNTGLRQMAEMPTGCLLIDMRVFERFKPPYFWHKPHPDGGLYGEDILFCHEAMERGFEIWCDMDLSMRLQHLGAKAFTIMEYHGAKGLDLPKPAIPAAAE